MSRRKKTINEMGLGMGAVAGGPGLRHNDPAEKLAQGAFGEAEDDLDMPPGMDDDLGGDMDDDLGGDLDDDLEGGGTVECSKDELRDLLSEVEMGEKSADEAFDQLCSAGECGDMDDLEGGDLDDLGGDDLGGDVLDGPVGGLSPGDDVLEGVQRIASLLTDDPDIFTS